MTEPVCNKACAKRCVFVLQNHLLNAERLHSKFKRQQILRKKADPKLMHRWLLTDIGIPAQRFWSKFVIRNLSIISLITPEAQLWGFGNGLSVGLNSGSSYKRNSLLRRSYSTLNIYHLRSGNLLMFSFPSQISAFQAVNWCFGLAAVAESISGNLHLSKQRNKPDNKITPCKVCGSCTPRSAL